MAAAAAALALALALLTGAPSDPGRPGRNGPDQSGPSPIADVLRDDDGDRVPDRTGETVMVGGRASVAAGMFGPSHSVLYVQDETGGIEVRGGPANAAAGDSLIASGTLRFENGMAYVEATAVRQVAAPARVPAPARFPADPEAAEGRLVAAEGVVIGWSEVEAGSALTLTLDDHTPLVAFVHRGRGLSGWFDALQAGDRVRVVGVGGQFDRLAPYSDSYQIYPRSRDDIEAIGVPAAVYRWSVVALSLLVVGMAAAFLLALRQRVAALRSSEERYRTLVERASDAVFVHGFGGEPLEVNREGRAALGLPASSLPPPFLRLVAPADEDAAHAHLARVREAGTARTDLRLAGPHGGRLYEVESRVLQLDGHDRVLSLARNVEAQRAYERGLVEAREQAEAMAEAKSAFLASMSHEIRTPLTAILGFAEILHEEVDEDQRDLAESITSGGRRLMATLNSVLDLASLDARRQALHPAPLDAAEAVRESVALLRSLAEARGLSLRVETAGAVPALLDAGALDRVLTNLVGNAIKFTEQGGVTVEVAAEGADVVLRVIDTGVGISPDFLPHLFAEFRQASEGHGRSHEGSGLGLAITDRLVGLMGGTIGVESTPGVGTTFTVTLPREPAAGDGAAPSSGGNRTPVSRPAPPAV
jgi:signal transduction histidine kinase